MQPLKVLDILEKALNAGNDQNWSWGPLIKFRPKSTAPQPFFIWLFSCALCIVVSLAVLTPLDMLQIILERYGPHAIPHLSPSALIRLLIYVLESWWFTSAALIACTLVPVLCALYAWAWNRRARRLSRGDAAAQNEHENAAKSWPPAPRG